MQIQEAKRKQNEEDVRHWSKLPNYLLQVSPRSHENSTIIPTLKNADHLEMKFLLGIVRISLTSIYSLLNGETYCLATEINKANVEKFRNLHEEGD